MSTITVASGGLTVTGKMRVLNTVADAYNFALSPATQNMADGSFATAKVTVTDAWGNPVATTDDTGVVRATATGEVRLGGLAPSQLVTTNAAGEGEVKFVACTATRNGALAETPAPCNAAFAWRTGYIPPTGLPAPTVSAAATVRVTASPSDKEIVITGSRTTVSGKPGIRVEGNAVGFADGDVVEPWIRFPGETTFSAGSARPTIDAAGDLSWQRKTGKRVTVHISSEDDQVRSNRVTIQAN